jgi:AcrR family transcriptional regulator
MTTAVVKTRRGRPRGAYAKSERTRAAILEAALAVFAKGGYRKGSLREIADSVGISEAGLLHHFKSKSVLLAEVLDLRSEILLEGANHYTMLWSEYTRIWVPDVFDPPFWER